MDILRCITNSVAGFFIGAIVGSVGGWLLGWLLAFWAYGKQGPPPPGDAPVYLTFGLIMYGACLVAPIGLLVGLVLAIRHAGQKAQGA